MDKRRRQYVPLSAFVAVGNTGTTLRKKFGRDGILVWVLYLAACKRNWIQGQFTYADEAEGWRTLGLVDDHPDFTLAEFFRATGQLKQTRIRRIGDLKDVICTHWREWNDEVKRDADSARKRRIEAVNTAESTTELARHNSGNAAALQTTEVEEELEGDNPPYPPLKGGSALTRKKRRYTGCKLVRGSHGMTYKYDVLGVDKPPPDWPHEPPVRQEVEAALAAER